MICYHGTPLGGKQIDKPAFLRNRHALVSFAYQDDMAVAAECCRSFAFDNGAFSAWRSGNAITDWIPYYEWVKEWIRHPGFDWCLIPDVIDGTERENDIQINQFVHWKGWGIRFEGGDYFIRSRAVPVWHLHESIERLKRLASGWNRVAFGSSGEFADPGSRNWWERMHESFAAICENGQPICKTHGLRMMDPAIFHRLPFSSVDSTNVAQNSGREADRHRCSELCGDLCSGRAAEDARFRADGRWGVIVDERTKFLHWARIFLIQRDRNAIAKLKIKSTWLSAEELRVIADELDRLNNTPNKETDA